MTNLLKYNMDTSNLTTGLVYAYIAYIFLIFIFEGIKLVLQGFPQYVAIVPAMPTYKHDLKDIHKLKKVELHEACIERGIRRRSSYSKKELIQLLLSSK